MTAFIMSAGQWRVSYLTTVQEKTAQANKSDERLETYLAQPKPAAQLQQHPSDLSRNSQTQGARVHRLADLDQQQPKFQDPAQVSGRFQNDPNQQQSPTQRYFTAEEKINISVYDNVNKSVVNIDTTANRAQTWFMGGRRPQEGSGSGWVLDRDGHIVTNHHVIANSDLVSVTLFEGEPFPAKVVGSDPQNDIAVLKIDAPQEQLFPVSLGRSDDLKVGQKVFAIGNPFGLQRTMTVGIISSLERSLPAKSGRLMKSIIQLDAALNQGNSGGPLLDNQSNLVGMNTAIATLTGENTGVGFAVPVNTIRRVIPQLLQFGEVRRATLGVELFWKSKVGLGVVKTEDNGPAFRAGIRGVRVIRKTVRRGNRIFDVVELDKDSADRLLAIDANEINSTDELNEALDQYKPGQTVNVKILREGVEVLVPVVLGLDR